MLMQLLLYVQCAYLADLENADSLYLTVVISDIFRMRRMVRGGAKKLYLVKKIEAVRSKRYT